MTKLSLAFLSGFLATLIFHQGGLLIFWALEIIPTFPWDLTPNSAGVPKILSLAFFGGLWALPSYALARSIEKFFWAVQIIFGSIFPTAVAMLVVFPLKGIAVSAPIIIGGLILNGLWGWGVGIGLKVFKLHLRS